MHTAFLPFVLCVFGAVLQAEDIVFPADASIADVTKAPYNADPTGKVDCTLALQAAFNSKNSIVYLPNGTYVISDTVTWGDRQNRQILQGQSESGTILRLPDHCSGYGVASTPKAMVWTGKAPAQRFRNGIRNITFHTGTGNAGAIGAQYIANNQGAIHHLSIVSGDGAGVIGLDLGYTDEQGPCLIKDVTVKGFNVGISMKHAVDGVVLEAIRVEDQRVAGLINDGQSVSMRGFTSRNAVPAIINKKGASMLALDVADLQGTGEAAGLAAIENDSGLFVRNLTTSGYQFAIDNQAGKTMQVVGPKVVEFVSHPVLSLFPSPPRSLNLPVKATPELPWDSLTEWVNVQNYRPKAVELIRPDGKKVNYEDWTEAIQQAIDSGKSTVYFPKGRYIITGEVRVRGKVKRLIGMDADSFNKPGGIPGGTIIFDDGESPVVVFERFDAAYSGLKLQHAGKRTLVMSSVLGNEWVSFEKLPGSGDVFLEDVCIGKYTTNGGNTWARQFNLEGYHFTTKISNDGGAVWILGLKTEDDSILIDAKNRAKTEVLGAFIYANKMRNPEKIMFSNVDSEISFSLGEWVIRNQPFNPIRETRGNETKTLRAGETPKRGQGAMIPLFVGYAGTATAAPTAPENLKATAVSTSGIEVTFAPKPGADGLLIETSLDGTAFTTVDTIAPEAVSYRIANGLKAGTTYRIRVTAFNAKGQAASPLVTIATQAGAPVGTGTGLMGEYFADKSFVTRKGTRTDALLNLDWKDTAPYDGVEGKSMSARWTGQIEPRFSETYHFSTERSKTRLWIDGQPVINAWNGRNSSGSIDLLAGKKYEMKLEMWSDAPNPAASLFWNSENQSREVVSTTQLYPATTELTKLALSVTATQMAETDTAGVIFTVTREGDTTKELTIELKPGGDAIAGVHYASVAPTLTLPAGSAKATIAITPLRSKKVDGDKTVSLSVPPSALYNVSGGTQAVIIKDADVPPAGTGTGLNADYYHDRAAKTLQGTRLDAQVSFGWDKGVPYPGIVQKKSGRETDGFAVHWVGEIQPFFSESYQFELAIGSYSGARLYIGDKLLIDCWKKGQLAQATMDLEAGRKYPIRIEFEHRNTYDARIQMKWKSASQYEQVVPKTQLYPAR